MAHSVLRDAGKRAPHVACVYRMSPATREIATSFSEYGPRTLISVMDILYLSYLTSSLTSSRRIYQP